MKKTNLLMKTAALSLLTLAAPSVMAQTEEVTVSKYLVVTEMDGTQTSFKLADSPAITFAAAADGENVTEMTVTAGDQTLTVAIADVKDYVLMDKEDTPSAIDQTVVSENGGKPEFANGKVYFSGLKPGARISVYTLDGVQALTVAAGSDGKASIDLGSLEKGTVYILRTPSAGYKILNK